MTSSRRRAVPWIHRWSRPITAGITLVGAIGTAYLTVVALTGGSAACPTQGCEQVLSSPYAKVFGLPLALFGMLAYVSMGAAAIAPLLINIETQKQLRNTLDQLTGLYLFVGGTAMAIFSGYLMYILSTKLQTACTYCIVSACLSLSLFILAVIGRAWEDFGQLIFTGIIVAMVTLVGTLGIYANVNYVPRGEAAPVVETVSGAAEIALAEHLTKIGAVEYGAFWCPHCHEQKVLFGKEAAAKLPYVECDAKGQNAKPDLCQKAGVKAFPTWVINGQTYEGVLPLNKLSDLSGYQGSRDFTAAPRKP